jgi:hypothetical protein
VSSSFAVAGPVSIGRAKSSNLVLDNASVSRLHAVVRLAEGGGWQIFDNDSANGVKVNSVAVAVKEAILRPKDKMVLGEYHMRFEEPEVHGILSHDTVRLPQRLVPEMTGSPYSGSFLPVVPVGSDVEREAEPRVNLPARVRLLERENALLTLLLRVNRALGDLESVEDVAQRVLDVVLAPICRPNLHLPEARANQNSVCQRASPALSAAGIRVFT